ncbi:MAG TPA: FIST N-terminal domain-containing protein, partial [Kofleriaceae bacterium]
MEPIARQAMATGGDPQALAQAIADQLVRDDLRIAFVFADHRLPPEPFAAIQGATRAPVVGCSAAGVLGPGAAAAGAEPCVVGLGLYGDWLRVGVGVAAELSAGDPLVRSRDAVRQAAAELGASEDALDPGRHVAVSLFDGLGSQVEAFCIGSAAAVPKLRFLGAGSSTVITADDPGDGRHSHVWARGEARL